MSKGFRKVFLEQLREISTRSQRLTTSKDRNKQSEGCYPDMAGMPSLLGLPRLSIRRTLVGAGKRAAGSATGPRSDLHRQVDESATDVISGDSDNCLSCSPSPRVLPGYPNLFVVSLGEWENGAGSGGIAMPRYAGFVKSGRKWALEMGHSRGTAQVHAVRSTY